MSTTLEEVIIDLLMHGCDRGALVQRATATEPVAVCVLMLSDPARAKIGTRLVPVLRALGDSAKMDIGQLTEQSTLGELFAMAGEAQFGWAWFTMQFARTEVMAAIVVGEDASRQVARICNAFGAPCSLDPRKAAEGYEITETKHRA